MDDEALRPAFRQLTGQDPVKPFECVGTIDEVNAALRMSLAKYYKDSRPCLLCDYEPVGKEVSLHTLTDEHNLSEGELSILKQYVL